MALVGPCEPRDITSLLTIQQQQQQQHERQVSPNEMYQHSDNDLPMLPSLPSLSSSFVVAVPAAVVVTAAHNEPQTLTTSAQLPHSPSREQVPAQAVVMKSSLSPLPSSTTPIVIDTPSETQHLPQPQEAPNTSLTNSTNNMFELNDSTPLSELIDLHNNHSSESVSLTSQSPIVSLSQPPIDSQTSVPTSESVVSSNNSTTPLSSSISSSSSVTGMTRSPSPPSVPSVNGSTIANGRAAVIGMAFVTAEVAAKMEDNAAGGTSAAAARDRARLVQLELAGFDIVV
jgi:hypothetical protein